MNTELMQQHPLDAYSPPYDLGRCHHGPRFTPNNRAVYLTFDGGSVHWTPEYGCIITKGEIKTAWERHNWESGPLGVPKENERPISQDEITILLSDRRDDYGSTFVTRYGRCTEFEGGTIYFWRDPDDQDIITTILKDGKRFDENVSPPERAIAHKIDPFVATLKIIKEGKRMGLAEIEVLISRQGAERLQGNLSIFDFVQVTGERESVADDKVVLRMKYK